MANLGTLYFDVDLNLNKLQQSIQSGNAQVLKDLQVKLSPDAAELKKSIENILNGQEFKVNLEANQDSINKIKEQLGQLSGDIKLTSSGGSLSPESLQSIVGLLTQQAQKTQEVANATKAVSDATKQAGDEEADAAKKANIELQRQQRLLFEVQSLYSKISSLSPENTGLSPAKINETANSFQNLVNKLKEIPPKTSLQELAAEFGTLKASTKSFFQEVGQSGKAVESIRLVRYALKEVNDQIASGMSSQKLEGFRDQLQAINREMRNMMKAGDFTGIQNLFAGHKGFSDGVVNIIRQAVTEMKKLGVATQETTAITTHLSEAEQKLAASIKGSTDSMRGQSQILSDLKSLAMQYLSVWGAQSFVHSIIQTGGLLEQQRMSIGAILGDLSQANHLFGQITQLALKSPFGVVQLDTMSKQLTAYNFKYSELYDWTKRLADISAATGTEVSRLALALGHVRSEGALSGYTLRQFAMGNVPLLQTLSQQLGKTTAEIRKMTREKAITYDDVEKALKTLTDAGGIFANAQEVMSNALNAKFKNLHDAFDIMFGNMAESAVGDALKGVAETLTILAKHWQETGAVILAVAGYMGIHKAATLTMNKAVIQSNLTTGQFTAKQLEAQAATGNLTKEVLLQAVATEKLAVADAEAAGATLGLSKAQLQQVATTGRVSAAYNLGTIATSKFTVSQLRMMATIRSASWASWTKYLTSFQLGLSGLASGAKMAGVALKGMFSAAWPLIAITAITEVFMHFKQKADEAEERVKDLMQTANEGYKALEREAQNFKVGASLGMDKKQLQESIGQMEEILKSYSSQSGNILSEAFKIDESTGKSVHSLQERYEMLAQAVEDTKDSYFELGKVKDILEESNDDTDGWFDESFRENTEDYIDALKERNKAENDFIAFHRTDIIQALNNTRGAFAELDKEISKKANLFKTTDGKEGFSEGNLKAQLDLLRDNYDYFVRFDGEIRRAGDDAFDAWANFNTEARKTKEALVEVDKDMKVFTTKTRDRLEAAFGASVDKWTNSQKLAVQKSIEIFMTGINGYSDMAEAERMALEEKLLAPFGIKIDVDSRDANKEITGIVSALNDLVGKDWVVKLKLNTVTDVNGLVDQLEKDVKSYETTIKRFGNLKGFKKDKDGNYIIPAPVVSTQKTSAIVTDWVKGETKVQESIIQTSEALDDGTQAAIAYNEARAGLKKANQIADDRGYNIDNKAADKRNKEASKANKKAIEELKNKLEEVKKFYAEYKKYRNVFRRDTAQSIVEEMFGIDHEEADNIINNYEDVLEGIASELDRLGDEKGALSVRQLIGDIKLDDAKRIADNILAGIKKGLEEQGSKWNLYKKILDATGSKEQASQIAFGYINSFSNFAAQLRSEIEEKTKGTGKSVDELLDMQLTDREKLRDIGIFENALNGIWQKLEKLRDAEQDVKAEEVELFLEALNNAKSLDTELAQIATKYQRTRDAINKAENLSSDEKSTLLINADQNQAREEANKQWEWFKKNTDGWGEMFGSMDRMTTEAIEDMIEKLEDFMPKVQGSEEAIKAVYEALEKMRDAVRERNPFKAIADSLKDISKYRSAIADIKKMFPDAKGSDVIGLDAATAGRMGLTDGTKGWTGTINQLIQDLNGARDAITKAIGNVTKVFGALQDVLQPVIDLFEQLGDTTLSKIFQIGSNALGTAASVAGGMSTLSKSFKEGSSLNEALSAAGPYVAAASAALSVATSIFAMHDEALQKEIEASQQRQKEMEKLSKNLQTAIERTLGGIYNAKASQETLSRLVNSQWKTVNTVLGDYLSSNNLNAATIKQINLAVQTESNFQAQLASLMVQRDELMNQMNAELDKKDSDVGAIADYEQQIADLNDQIDHFAEDMAKALYGIDVQSWAQDLTDAIVSAWESGEDAAEAYNKKVQELMKDLTTNILAKSILEDALSPVLDTVVQLMKENNGILGADVIGQIAQSFGKESEGAIAAITAILDELEKLGYISKESAEEAEGAFSNLRDSFSDTLTNMEDDAEAFRKRLEEIMVKDLIERNIFSQAFEVGGRAYDNLDKYIEYWNEEYEKAVAAGDQARIDELLNELVKVREITIEAAEELRDRLKSVADEDSTFKDLSDSWASALMDMSKTAEDWSKEVGKIMAEKIVKEMVVPAMLQPLLNNLQDVFNLAMAGAISTDENGNTTYDWDSILSNGSVLAALNALTEAYPEAKNVVMSIMERLGLDISNYKFSGFDNLADSILESLKGADTSLEKWAEEQGKKMAEEMAKAYIESKYGEQIKALNEEWQKALEKGDVARMEEIRKELEALYDTMGNDEKLKNLVDVFKELAENPFKDMASTFVSSLMDMENGAEEFSKNIAKTLTEQMLNKIITDQYQGKIDALGEQWRDALASGDTAAIERIRQQLIALREEMGEAVQPLIDSLSDLDTQVSYALNDMKSNFVSTLMDMTASTQDFANDISKIMAQTFIEKFVLGDMFDQRMESWQQQYESILGSDVDEETRKRQLKQLRDAIAAAREDYTDQANAIMELFGLTASSNQEATMNMADKITYDQADQLLGINLAQELTLEQILATLRENYVSPVGGGGLTWQSANGVQSDEQIRLISATLQSIADVQQTGNDNILTQVVMANSHLQLIRDYSKNIRDEVLLHLGSIDSKLTQLKNL